MQSFENIPDHREENFAFMPYAKDISILSILPVSYFYRNTGSKEK